RVGLFGRRAQPRPVGGEQRAAQEAGEIGAPVGLRRADPGRGAAGQVVAGIGVLPHRRLVLAGRLRVVPLLHPTLGVLALEQTADLVLQLVVQARTVLAAASFHASRSTLD